MRRAARWDGAVPITWEGIPASEWRAIIEFILAHRQSEAPYDFVHHGKTPGDSLTETQQIVAPYLDAGVTWWIEGVDPWRFGWKWEDKWSPEATVKIRERVLQGPPR